MFRNQSNITKVAKLFILLMLFTLIFTMYCPGTWYIVSNYTSLTKDFSNEEKEQDFQTYQCVQPYFLQKTKFTFNLMDTDNFHVMTNLICNFKSINSKYKYQNVILHYKFFLLFKALHNKLHQLFVRI